jgi:hypothetical protein
MADVAFAAYLALSVIGLTGIGLYMIDGIRAEKMIEERPDRDAFMEHLKKVPIREKIRYALLSTDYVKNMPLLTEQF